MVGDVGLNNDVSGLRASARAPCNLGEELEDVFTSAEVGDVEASIGVDHTDKGH